MCLTMSFQRSKFVRDVVGFVGHQGVGEIQEKLSHHLILSTKGGGQYQGVGAVDEAMVARSQNCLVGSKRVDDLQIPP
jgi:hypothetical protein